MNVSQQKVTANLVYNSFHGDLFSDRHNGQKNAGQSKKREHRTEINIPSNIISTSDWNIWTLYI